MRFTVKSRLVARLTELLGTGLNGVQRRMTEDDNGIHI
uniref:Uncharacterized protein n=1 Tax=Anguilla anguilla TaxID=7936 RepID=A0A0E9U953_ANGAN